ncbi:MAG: DUF1937 family protein [Pseudomonas sp.]
MIPIIYVAGPYRAATHELVAANIAAARQVAVLTAHLGWFPICPHTNTAHFEVDLEDKGDDFWLAGTMALMERCDAVVLVPGWRYSSGTLAEIHRAREMGLPIFTSAEGLPPAAQFDGAIHGRSTEAA